jgi:hypothetical protein
MINSTSITSAIGVTLISATTDPFPNPRLATRLTPSLKEVIDQLG